MLPLWKQRCRLHRAGQRYAPAEPNQCYLYGSSAVDSTGLDNAMPLLNQTNAILIVTLTTTHGTDNAIFILIHVNATSMVEPKKEDQTGQHHAHNIVNTNKESLLPLGNIIREGGHSFIFLEMEKGLLLSQQHISLRGWPIP